MLQILVKDESGTGKTLDLNIDFESKKSKLSLDIVYEDEDKPVSVRWVIRDIPR